MATTGPPQPPPGSVSASIPQPQPIPANSDQITWDGDKMFNIYILDYCKKRGYHKTANQLVAEADIPPESKPPINAQQGLLFEWWSVFWVLFQAKNSGNGTEDALLYHKYQNQQRQRPNQVPPGVPQPPGRYPLPNGLTGPPLPNPQVNGIGPTGQPPLTLGASPYGPANPAAQPNGIPAPPAPPGPGQPFPGGIAGRPPLAPQQRMSNGPQYHSPTIAPSPQSHPQQPPTGPMGQLGRSPHMSTINRAAMLPPNGPQPPQGPGPAGSAHPTPSPYQPLGRPPSSHDTSHHPMNPHSSPAMGGGRIPPGQERQHMDGPQGALDAELASYPAELIGEAKFRAGLGERDAQSLTAGEKQTIIHHATRLKQSQPQNNIAGPSGPHMHGQLQNRGPMAQPMQQQISMQQQRVAKRSSTSPGEEHQTLPRNEQSPPDRKRPRRTPNPAEQQQQQPQPQQPQQSQQQQSQPQPPPTPQQSQQTPQPPPQQPQQPPMAPMSQLPSGPQTMPGTGSVRGSLPMPGGQAPLNGFGGPPMHPMGMGHGPMGPMHTMSSGMVTGPMMAQSQMLYQGQYRPGMVPPPKGNPNMPGPPVGPGDPQAQAHMRGGQVPNRLGSQLVQPGQPPKPMGGSMLPPGQPGMNGPPKPGGKEGEGELNAPLNPAGSTPTPQPPLLNSGPPMNSSRPPTASAPLPSPAPPPPPPGQGSMTELPFDMAEMFGNHGGDFDFGGDPLAEMNLWFDQTAVHDGTSLDMK